MFCTARASQALSTCSLALLDAAKMKYTWGCSTWNIYTFPRPCQLVQSFKRGVIYGHSWVHLPLQPPNLPNQTFFVSHPDAEWNVSATSTTLPYCTRSQNTKIQYIQKPAWNQEEWHADPPVYFFTLLRTGPKWPPLRLQPPALPGTPSTRRISRTLQVPSAPWWWLRFRWKRHRETVC